MRHAATFLAVALFQAATFLSGQTVDKPGPKPATNLLVRRYREGESLAYHMTATNQGRGGAIHYEADAHGVVKKDASGAFVEEYTWSNLRFNGQKVPLPESVAEFRQLLSLDPALLPALPNLGGVNPMLIGPIADLLTFYADDWLAIKQDALQIAGDHVYAKHGTANSWADGVRTLVGEDSIDFDITLNEVNQQGGMAKMTVRHVPPAQPQIRKPAKWMETPVADTANNWVEVSKEDNGKYFAEIGKETFDVELKVGLGDGRIIAATMDNPVTVVGRECGDAQLTNCGDLQRYQIRRQIELRLLP